jgi:hypothetical protein
LIAGDDAIKGAENYRGDCARDGNLRLPRWRKNVRNVSHRIRENRERGEQRAKRRAEVDPKFCPVHSALSVSVWRSPVPFKKIDAAKRDAKIAEKLKVHGSESGNLTTLTGDGFFHDWLAFDGIATGVG